MGPGGWDIREGVLVWKTLGAATVGLTSAGSECPAVAALERDRWSGGLKAVAGPPDHCTWLTCIRLCLPSLVTAFSHSWDIRGQMGTAH